MNGEFSWALEQYLLGRYPDTARPTSEGEYNTVKMYLTPQIHEAMSEAAQRDTRTLYGQIEVALKQVYPNAQKDFSSSKLASTSSASE